MRLAIAGCIAQLAFSTACTTASLRPLDAETEDAAADGGLDAALDAAPDAGADAGADAAVDAWVPPSPAVPLRPSPPDREPDIDWLAATDPEVVAAADPVAASPEAPDFGDCAPWAGGGADPCEPWSAGHEDCAGASEHFPGELGCRSIGSSCPAAGEWAADLPSTGTVVYVRAGAAGGTGTAAAPFGTLAAALADAALRSPPVVIALAAGTYAGGSTVPDGVTLWGACTEGTRLDGSPGVVNVRAGAASALRNLRLYGGSAGVEAPSGAAVTIDRVLVEGTSRGVAASGGTVDASDLVVRGLVGEGARGVEASTGGHVTLTRAVVRDAPAVGSEGLVATGTGSVVALEDVAVTGTDGGIGVRAGARLDAMGLVVERTGWSVFFADSTISLRRAVIRDVPYHGLHALSTTITVDGVLVERVGAWGVSLNGMATMRDVVVRDVARYEPFDFDGTGIATWRSSALLERVRVERTAGVGLAVWEGGDVTARSLDVRDTGRDARRRLVGAGVHVTDTARLSLSASRIVRARVAGVVAGTCIAGRCIPPILPERSGTGTVVDLTDVAITGTLASFDEALPGHGMLASGGARITANRVSVSDTGGPSCAAGPLTGLAIADPGTVELTDVRLSGPTGVLAYDGAVVEGSRVVIAPAEQGIVARSATVTLEDLVVADATDGVASEEGAEVSLAHASILRATGDCARSDAASLASTDARLAGCGRGLIAMRGATARLRRVAMSDLSATVIECAGEGTSVDLADVGVSDDAGDGMAVLARQGAAVTVSALAIDAARRGLVEVTDRDTSLTGEHVTLACAAATTDCATLTALSGAALVLSRVRLTDARGLGVGAAGPGSEVTLSDLQVIHVAPGACGEERCATAVGAYDSGSVAVSAFDVDDVDGTAAQLGDATARLELTTGRIADASVGLAHPPTIPLTAILDGVVFEACGAQSSPSPGPWPDVPLP